jgi:hypothetical protein
MSRTKRKGIWQHNLKHGGNWIPGNPDFDKSYEGINVTIKAFEEMSRRFMSDKCKCDRCLKIAKNKFLKNSANKEIKDFTNNTPD